MHTPSRIGPATGKLGVLLPGLGAVATTAIAGVEAVRLGLSKPIGSFTQMATIRLGKKRDNRSPLIRDFVPLFDLGAQLGFRDGPAGATDPIVILTTQEDGSRAALIVDQIMEQRQVVIKGLSRNYGAIPGVAAATILGDGQVALILDPSDLTSPSPAQAEPDVALAG